MTKAYAGTVIGVSTSEGNISDLLADRGVTDLRWTQTARMKALEFNYPLREMVKPGRMKTYHSYRGSYTRTLEKPEYRVRAVLGVRIVVPWDSDQREQKRIMRVLYWMLKSKFEIIESGLTVFEEEFMPHLSIAHGKRLYDEFRPQLERQIERRKGDLRLGIGEETLPALGTGRE